MAISPKPLSCSLVLTLIVTVLRVDSMVKVKSAAGSPSNQKSPKASVVVVKGPPIPVRVQVGDGTGTLQNPEGQDIFPKGATGYQTDDFRA